METTIKIENEQKNIPIAEPGKKKKIIIAAIVVIVIIASIFFFRSGAGKASETGNAVKEFTIDAFKFGYNPELIEVNQGDKVKLNIVNTDVPHGIRIPDMDLYGENSVEFTADKPGEYIWYCYVPCGDGHMKMRGKIMVK